MSTVASLNDDGMLTGLSGRRLSVNKEWDNPEGKFRVGMKLGYDLYPADLKSRVKVRHELLDARIRTGTFLVNNLYQEDCILTFVRVNGKRSTMKFNEL
jgi:hypothetical protein